MEKLNDMEMKPKTTRARKAWNIIVDVLVGLVVACGLFLTVFSLSAKANGGVPTIFSTSIMEVKTNSMTGTINVGDLIFVKTVHFEEGEPSIPFVENETIAAFWYDLDGDGTQEIVTHQYIGQRDFGGRALYMFQGTYKENASDILATQSVTEASIIGVYQSRVAHLGRVFGFLRSSVGFLIVIVLPIFAFFIYQGYRLIVTYLEVKRENQTEAAVLAAKLSDEEKERERERLRQEILAELTKNTDEEQK